MLFTIPFNSKLYTEDQIKAKVFIIARRRILLYPQKTNEKLLDKYIKENYNSKLKFICLKILMNATISTNTDNEVVVTMANKQLDKIASLISYGIGKVPGSNILKYAFSE